jgi:transcriptional repressor NrdR
VIDTRVGREGTEIRRRRECEECGRRFTTRERLEISLPQVIKRDQRREDYERQKLVTGIMSACVKRPVSADAIARLADRVEAWLHEAGDREVPSRSIGDRVMADLKALDALSAIRFASVYQSFGSTADYAAFMERLEAEPEDQ